MNANCWLQLQLQFININNKHFIKNSTKILRNQLVAYIRNWFIANNYKRTAHIVLTGTTQMKQCTWPMSLQKYATDGLTKIANLQTSLKIPDFSAHGQCVYGSKSKIRKAALCQLLIKNCRTISLSILTQQRIILRFICPLQWPKRKYIFSIYLEIRFYPNAKWILCRTFISGTILGAVFTDDLRRGYESFR